jgi:hypothetical protein
MWSAVNPNFENPLSIQNNVPVPKVLKVMDRTDAEAFGSTLVWGIYVFTRLSVFSC